MARQVVRTSTALDRKGYQLVVDLYGGAYAGTSVSEEHPGLRYATEVIRTLGAQYSYCYVGIPVDTFGEEEAFTCCLAKDGPAGRVKLRSRAKVKMVDYDGKVIDLLVGYLVQYAHSIDEDSVTAMVVDDRWLLSKVTCFGRGVYDPVTGNHYFDAGSPCIMNYNGYPNCIDSPYGPRFAPSGFYGYDKTESVNDANEPKIATNKARSWKCCDIATYLRDMYYCGARPKHPQDYGKQQLSQYIDWPKSFGQQYGFVRVPRHFDLENIEVGEALVRLARKAGPYEINMVPNSWRGQLQLVQINSRKAALMLTGPKYGANVSGGSISMALEDSTRIAGGTVIESIVGYFDEAVVAGDPPALEHQYSMADSTTGGIPIELENAWTPDEEAGFKAIINDNGKNEDAFQFACQAYPRVYCSYKISSAYAAYKKTYWPTWAPPYTPRILPQLLSGYAMRNENPRDWNPREMVIEYLDESTSPAVWKPCSRFDALELIDDGMSFRVEALRNGSTRALDRVTFTSSGFEPSTYAARKMRLTCAVEREFRIAAKDKTDPNETNGRINQIAERFTFLYVAAPGEYSHWERYLSRPNGNAVGEPLKSGTFPDLCKGTNDSWLFSDLNQVSDTESTTRLQRHAKHRNEDVKRIDYHGVLTMHTWCPTIQPGLMVSVNMGGNDIVPTAVVKSTRFNSTNQCQEIELMAGDNSVIYDMPFPVHTQAAGGAPTPPGSTQPKTTPNTGVDDYPREQSSPRAPSMISAATTSANDPRYEAPPSSSGAMRGADHRDATRRDSMSILRAVEGQIQTSDAAKKARQMQRTIRTGEEMSKVDEGKYSLEAADQRRRDEAEKNASQRERKLMDKALRKSVRRDRDEDETE